MVMGRYCRNSGGIMLVEGRMVTVTEVNEREEAEVTIDTWEDKERRL